MTLNEIQQILDEYLELFPDEAKRLERLQHRLAIDEVFNDRYNFQGHGTGSAIVLSPDRRKVLMIFHNHFQRWLQPGGHWESEEDNPWTVAQREVEEETGVQIATLLPVVAAKSHVPLDIDSHDVTARPHKNEPAHIHHDFRYVFLAKSEELMPQISEVSKAEWVGIDSSDKRLASIANAVKKLKDLHFLR